MPMWSGTQSSDTSGTPPLRYETRSGATPGEFQATELRLLYAGLQHHPGVPMDSASSGS